MPVPVTSTPASTRILLSVVFASTLACAGPPGVDEGSARLVGAYRLFDSRSSFEGINPSYKSASLVLRPDGTALQVCIYHDGTKYESSGMTWAYRGDGNVHLSPFKDCSWVHRGAFVLREGPLEKPEGGASLIVQWGNQPNILIHPDLNPFYQWQEAVK